MSLVVLLPRAEAQIVIALDYTQSRFGENKMLEYRALVREALQALAVDSKSGLSRPAIHPDAWIYPISQPGRRARHIFLYRIRVEVEVARFLYDGRDLGAQWPREWRKK